MNDWQSQAACIGADTELFYQETPAGRPRQNPLPDPHTAARAICATCDVILSCRKWATDAREPGFWGGMTEQERSSALRRATRGAITTSVLTPADEAARERLWRQGLSDPAIAEVVGRSARGIRNWRTHRGYPSNVPANKQLPDWVNELREQLYQAGLPDQVIADGAKTTIDAIKNWRRRRGSTANTSPKVDA
jgi:WhiB family redox-sensing transcriptional regulator